MWMDSRGLPSTLILFLKGCEMAVKSFRHGTVEGYKHCKPPCVNCTTANATGQDLPTEPIPVMQGSSNGFDVIQFLHGAAFNHIIIDKVLGDNWSCEIKASGDKYVGFGIRPDYALNEAVRRYQTSQPATGPITMTYDQTTFETSQGRALADEETMVPVEIEWSTGDLPVTDGLPD
jgi:hypothetical protein